MKKYIFSALAAFALCCTFEACSNKNDDPDISYSTTAAQGSAGTYTGTWTRISDEGTTEYSGTVTLAAASGDNATSITFSCPEADLNATSIANIWHSNYGFKFVNQTVSTANTLGVAFSGIIDEEGNLNTAFTVSQKVGRKNYEFKYEFKGKK